MTNILNKNIAICYFGLTRSTKKVYLSHIENIFNILKNNNIYYEIFMHTWKTLDGKQNTRGKDYTKVNIDYDEYKLLNPNHYKIEIQDEFLNSIDFSKYFYKNVYDKYKFDKVKGEWKPNLIKNHLCALESQKRVLRMVNTNIFNRVIFVRPDVMIKVKLNIEKLLNMKKHTIILPFGDNYEGYNDRFAICTWRNAHEYGDRINEIIEFRKKNGRIVSEKYVKFIIEKYKMSIDTMSFPMEIIR